MAGDMAVTADSDYVFNVKKIAKIKGYLIGACGDLDLVYWFTKNFQPEIITEKLRVTPPSPITDKDGFEGMIVSPRGTIYLYTDKCMAIPIKDFGYFSIGSGSPLALGAMFCGANAVEAVRAAIKHDKSTGGRIQSVKLRG